MDKIRRIYVERKDSIASRENLLLDIRNNLKIKAIDKIRVVNCYDVAGIKDSTFEKSIKTVFSEAPLDNVYDSLVLGEDEHAFAVAYLSGQFDQRANSTKLLINVFMDENEAPIVRASKIYVLKGKLDKNQIDAVKNYIINPVDSKELPLEMPESLALKANDPKDIETVNGFIAFSQTELEAYLKKMNLSMTYEDLLHCQNYFKNEEKRDPSVTEIKVLDTYWSDHCRHTTFMTKIENVSFYDDASLLPIKEAYELYNKERDIIYKDRNDKYICLMDIAQMGMRVLKSKGLLNDLDESEEINACSIRAKVDVDGVDEDYLIMFKNETHNHPTEIEPFGGASTCLGGAIRDPLSGRSYVYQAMRITGSGNPLTPVSETIEGKLPQRTICTTAAKGYSSYGNQIGVGAGGVTEIYHDGYVAKRMELGAVISSVKAENVVRQVPIEGDVVILLGGKTGRDGCGGATGSSKEHTEDSILNSGAEVQKGDPPIERRIVRLFRKGEATKLIKRCNDFGAGGVSVAIGELANGLDINLDTVPTKYDGLDGTELAISESQERMAVVIGKDDCDKFIEYAEEEGIEATIVAVVTKEERLVINWRNKAIVNISRAFLDTNGAGQKTDIFVNKPELTKDKFNEGIKVTGHTLLEKWYSNLEDINVCSQKGLVEKFDSTINASTVLLPLGGKHQLTPALSMASKIPLEKGETNTATIMSYGYDPFISSLSPFHGGMFAVIDSVNKIVLTGGNPETVRLTFQEFFEKLRDEPARWGKPFSALLGAFKAQMEMKIPSVGGKDSMSGSFNEIDVPETLVSFAVSVSKADKIISPEFKKADSKIIAIFVDYDDNCMPSFENVNKINQTVYNLIQEGKILSAHNIGLGGLGAAVSKMSFGNHVAFNINADEEKLFTPNYGGFVIEINESEISNIPSDVQYEMLGSTVCGSTCQVNGNKFEIEEALSKWISPLESIYPIYYDEETKEIPVHMAFYSEKNKTASIFKTAKPKVVIPVFGGTNGEYDLTKVFEANGGEVEICVIKDLNKKDLDESIRNLANSIKNAQILAVAGGISLGGEPDGLGKYIAEIFRRSEVAESINELIGKKDGLILGIGEGFHGLLKSGLLTHGKVNEYSDSLPSLTYNYNDSHVATIVNTKVVSTKSPWLWNTTPGEIYKAPFSSNSGRFCATEEDINKLAANNQIAIQYVDDMGRPSYEAKFNPANSFMAVEAITCQQGRILGKTCHSERIGKNIYKNIFGDLDMKLFISGINYYK